MLRAMTRRTPFLRCLAIAWASLQLMLPGVTAIADGFASSQGASAAVSHVESGSTASCPEIHGVDCAVCRYLSNTASTIPAAPAWRECAVGQAAPVGVDREQADAARSRAQSRAPPVV